MTTYASISKKLRAQAKSGDSASRFFKTSPGSYSAHDLFLGVSVPAIRRLAKDYFDLKQSELDKLLASPYNEERLFALIVLVDQYNQNPERIYEYYLSKKHCVNNWNLVDSSAHHIVGAHLFKSNKNVLLTLVQSENLWDRRIAIVSTWYFIRQNELVWTFKLAKKLLKDEEDLIHKAVGWMLREAGKRDEDQLKAFLNEHASQMPRTMLRYSIEKFSPNEKKKYMSMK
jgi:3-methyladenine DNA glycosylase AlkD